MGQYKPRIGTRYQTYNIWLGLAGKVKRLNTLKISGNPAEPEETRSKIDFFIERKIDQSRSMVTTDEDKANDVVGQADFKAILKELCSEQLYFSRQIRGAAKDEDGNLAEPSKASTFIQIISKAQDSEFGKIRTPRAAQQREDKIVKVGMSTAKIAGTISGVAVVIGSLVGCALFSGQIKNAFTGGGKDKK